jgi:hypothetical protein
VGAALVLAWGGRLEAGSRFHGYCGPRRTARVHQRFYEARNELRCRIGYARARHLGHGVRRHHGPGHGGYGYASGVRRFHGLGDGYYATHGPSRSWHAVRPHYVVPYPYAGGYGYDGWISVGAPDYHRTSDPPVVTVVSTQRADAVPPAPKPTRSQRAWSLLARGEARAALSEFAVLALRSTGDAQVRAGYGLAAAMLGKHDTAIWAMRRALDTNAGVVRDLALEAELNGRVRRLAEHYADRARRRGETGAQFMTATLLLLLHDDDAAAAAVAAAVEAGDTEPSTRALDDLLTAERDRGGAEPTETPGELVAKK